nr:hypothetical protein HUO10_000056 [Paraburkholderia busanensis]
MRRNAPQRYLGETVNTLILAQARAQPTAAHAVRSVLASEGRSTVPQPRSSSGRTA